MLRFFLLTTILVVLIQDPSLCRELPPLTAVTSEDIHALRQGLEHGVNPNIQDKHGFTAIFGAIEKNNFAMVSLLIKHGADVNHRALKGYTPLMLAAFYGYNELVLYLVKNGAHLNDLSHDGQTALSKAAEKGHFDTVRLLHQQGASIHLNKDIALYQATYGKNVELLAYLLKHGADPNASNQEGITALMNAASLGDLNMLKLLVSKGASIHKKRYNDYDALYSAYMRRYSSNASPSLDFLLSNGANPNEKYGVSKTPLLTQAAIDGDLDLVKQLLLYKADINAVNASGETVTRYLVQYMPVSDAVLKQKQKDILRFLIKNGADFNLKANNGPSAIGFAVVYGQLESLEIFLDLGGDPNGTIALGQFDYPYLVISTIMQRIEMVSTLLKHGANKEALDGKGKTALFYAKEKNNQKLIRMLSH